MYVGLSIRHSIFQAINLDLGELVDRFIEYSEIYSRPFPHAFEKANRIFGLILYHPILSPNLHVTRVTIPIGYSTQQKLEISFLPLYLIWKG